MGEVAEAIRRKLDAAFAPQKLDVVDESDKHAGLDHRRRLHRRTAHPKAAENLRRPCRRAGRARARAFGESDGAGGIASGPAGPVTAD
jgi:hypothetical protein